jgi:hypothetical protein
MRTHRLLLQLRARSNILSATQDAAAPTAAQREALDRRLDEPERDRSI